MSGLAGEKGKEGLQAPPEKPTSFMEVKGKLLALPTPTEAKAVMGNGEKRPQQKLVKLVTRLMSLWWACTYLFGWTFSGLRSPGALGCSDSR